MTQHAWILEFPYFASLSSGRLDALRGEAPAGQRVLVHCSAGLNRSVTICCAALILLEGLSAEAALDRIFEHHP